MAVACLVCVYQSLMSASELLIACGNLLGGESVRRAACAYLAAVQLRRVSAAGGCMAPGPDSSTEQPYRTQSAAALSRPGAAVAP